MAEGSEGSEVVRSIRHAGATYSSHLVAHVLKISDETSSIRALALSILPCPLRWLAEPNSMGILSNRHRCSITAAENSPYPSALMNEGTPNLIHRSTSTRANPRASFDGNGHAKKNFDALSTTSSTSTRCPLPICWGISAIPSNTSHGSRNLAGSMVIRWLRGGFLRLQPHDKTYSRASLHMPGQWNVSRVETPSVLPLGDHVGSVLKRARMTQDSSG